LETLRDAKENAAPIHLQSGMPQRTRCPLPLIVNLAPRQWLPVLGLFLSGYLAIYLLCLPELSALPSGTGQGTTSNTGKETTSCL
jgi:hypothetical protein